MPVADDVRGRANLVAIVSDTTPLNAVGRRLLGRCPIHGGSEPTLAVHAEEQRFVCFECDASGDVFDFVQATQGVDYQQAVEWVAARSPGR
jgi:DNA primase